jgi:hypothetical protein
MINFLAEIFKFRWKPVLPVTNSKLWYQTKYSSIHIIYLKLKRNEIFCTYSKFVWQAGGISTGIFSVARKKLVVVKWRWA